MDKNLENFLITGKLSQSTLWEACHCMCSGYDIFRAIQDMET